MANWIKLKNKVILKDEIIALVYWEETDSSIAYCRVYLRGGSELKIDSEDAILVWNEVNADLND